MNTKKYNNLVFVNNLQYVIPNMRKQGYFINMWGRITYIEEYYDHTINEMYYEAFINDHSFTGKDYKEILDKLETFGYKITKI